jgi:DNA-binding beta-propeller fold protein YncE
MTKLNRSRQLAAHSCAGCYLLVLAGMLATIAPLRADSPPTYLFEIDSSAVPKGFVPAGVAIDINKNVYITDISFNPFNRIVKFTSGGAYLTQWNSYNGLQFYPTGIALDSNNVIYVADNLNAQYLKFDSNGNFIGSGALDSVYFPAGIAVGISNHVYVASDSGNNIVEFDSNGTSLTSWGAFQSPDGVAIDHSNNVYVVDFGAGHIAKFDSNGNYLMQWGSPGASIGQFSDPSGIAIDVSNNVYVTDTGNNRVEKFDSNGNFLAQWGTGGSGPGQFSSPQGIAVDASGNFIYVADQGNQRIQVFVNNSNIVPPIITSQPLGHILPEGVNVTMNVGVVGTAPFAYQWNSNNIALPGATNATFTLTNVGPSVSGTYTVLVTNINGSVLSSNAVLTVLPVAIAITQPASGLSATGAVLNGSATVGPQETVVWLDWGTDTNYGNVAGTTVVPGNSGSNSVSVALTGLPGNFYHYRLVAANDFGIVYGNDQLFTVGFAPAATTLAAVTSTNGATLNATVNPNGWDTTVYFKWEVAFNVTNTTPVMDVGAGATSLNVSNFITGLAPAKQYDYQVVASNHLGTIFGAQLAFYTPPFVTVPNENWDSVASSADGSVLVAVANNNPMLSTPGGPIYISTNSGAAWAVAAGAPTNGLWETVACSADGSKMIAAGGGGVGSYVFPIYTSSDTGATWVSNNAPVANWQSVASSADGTRLVAADYRDQVIYTSTNSGAVWTRATNAPKTGWFSVALSADGLKLAAVAFSSASANIYTSPDFGTTWITNNVPAGPPQGIQRNWSSIASSADGSKLIAAAGGNNTSGFIFISTNSGAAWKVTATNILFGLTAHPWISVASSADGSKLAAVSDATRPLGVLITSTNSGATWTTNAVPFLDWNAVALSADGAKLVVTVGYPSTGPIYVSQTTPAPQLNLSASANDTVISWIIPSLDFTLQQSPDLLSWTDVTNLPVLNLTNLDNQVVLPPPAGNGFFRLMH